MSAAIESPLTPCSDDSDEVNTSTAKIYFGPVLSPEKKLAPMLSPRIFSQHDLDAPEPSLLRRSLRLSSPPLPPTSDGPVVEDSEQEEEEEEDSASPDKDGGNSWQSTPLQRLLRQDEPSSAIATRIMRAHDNPSPPPKALRVSSAPRRLSKLANELAFPPIDTSDENSDAAVEKILTPPIARPSSPMSPLTELIPVSPPTSPLSRRQVAASPTPRRIHRQQSPRVPSNIDLISFDQSMHLSPRADATVIHAPSPKRASPTLPTVDDLLFSSPLRLGDDQPPAADVPYLVIDEAPQEITPAGLSTSSTVLLSPDRAAMPRRRSPRLSAPSPPPPEAVRLKTPEEETPRPQSPRSPGSKGRRRLRDGPEKRLDGSTLHPIAMDWQTDSDVTENESDTARSPGKPRKRARRVKDIEGEPGRLQLTQSLSPESSRILTSLTTPERNAPTSPTPDDKMTRPDGPSLGVSGNATDTGYLEAELATAVSIPSSVQRPPPGTMFVHNVTPSRGPLATKNLLSPHSPVKLTLTPAPDDPSRTPARRVLISSQQHGSSGPNFGQQIAPGVTYTPVFSRPLANGGNRSPAKRIPISEAMSVDQRPKSPISSSSTKRPSRSPSTEPSEAAEFIVVDNGPIAGPSRLTPTSSSNPVASTSKKPVVTRMFLAPEAKSTAAETISPNKRAAPPAQSGSRIPRINTVSKAASDRTSKLPLLSSRKPTSSRLPSPVKPVVKDPLRAGLSRGPDIITKSTGLGRVVASKPSRNGMVAPPIKRKRDNDKGSPPRPLLKFRQVVPGMFGGPAKTTTLAAAENQALEQQGLPSPVREVVQQKGPIKVREVVRGTLQDFELRAASSKTLQSLFEARAKEQEEAAKAAECQHNGVSLRGLEKSMFTFECAVPERGSEPAATASELLVPQSTSSDASPSSDDVVMAEAAAPLSEVEDSLYAGTRRSSRTRKPVQQIDVFGNVSSILGTGPSGASRRNRGTGPPKGSTPGSLVFQTNGLALKTLTNNNTARNQQYHTQLETHIIRKVGNRPESPTMKLRTILEKQKEEQGKMRAERARRRRMGEGSEAGDSSMDVDVERPVDIQPLKHPRGAGEDEDYESPYRPNANGKRVKWDRALESTVFLDEIEVQPEKHRKFDISFTPRKGCLISGPDKPALDSLGNALNADAPLGLAAEKVVVTKYVYDNDEDTQLAAPPPQRSTRSKARKSR